MTTANLISILIKTYSISYLKGNTVDFGESKGISLPIYLAITFLTAKDTVSMQTENIHTQIG